jgi:two-component system sensor histidine kinase BaeS
VAALLGLAALNPDALIAKQNLGRYDASGKVDWHYLRNLSADAVPVFEGRSNDDIRCGLPRYWTHDEDWLSWNLGRVRAHAAIDDGPASMATALATTSDSALADCPESQ